MIERRLTKRLEAYWKRICREDATPQIKSFNPRAVESLWKNCFCLEVDVDKKERICYTYTYIGENLIEIFGNSLLKRRVSSNVGFLPAKEVIVRLDDLVFSPKYEEFDGRFIGNTNGVIKYRSCILPFCNKSNKDGKVDSFIIGLSWIKIAC